MSIVKTIRDYFGWSQESLSFYLGVSRSLVKLAEAELRNLPIAADLKLAPLHLFILGKDANGEALPKTNITAPPAKADGKKLLRQASRYALLAEKTQLQLADMQQRYQQAQNNKALFQHLHPTVIAATTEEAKDDTLWLELIQAKAVVQLRRNGPDAQAMLQWRIDCYQFAAERAKELGGG